MSMLYWEMGRENAWVVREHCKIPYPAFPPGAASLFGAGTGQSTYPACAVDTSIIQQKR
jgi:hypothetical protein